MVTLTESSDGADLKCPQVSWHTSHNLQLPVGSPLAPTHPESAKHEEQSMTPLLRPLTLFLYPNMKSCQSSYMELQMLFLTADLAPGVRLRNFRCQSRGLSANSLYVGVQDAQSLIKEVSLIVYSVYPGFWILGTQ